MIFRVLFVAVIFGLLAIGAPPAEAAGLAVDQLVTTNQGTNSRTIVSPAFSTTATNELLLAFISSDGPTASGAQTFASVTGAASRGSSGAGRTRSTARVRSGRRSLRAR